MSARETIRELFYRGSRFIVRVFCLVWLRLSVRGAGNIPKTGAYIFAANHTSHLDPPVCGVVNPRPLTYLAKKELFRNPVLGWLLRTYYVVPLDREKGDLRTIRVAIETLRSGRPLLMMPEGTRSETGEIGAAKRGIGLIIDKTGVPVVPCYIDGTHQAMRKKSKMIRPAKVRVLIGGPVAFGGGSPGEPNDQRQMRIAEKVLESIAQLKAEMESGL